MSSNQDILQNAQNLNYHYLVVRALEAMHKLNDGHPLEDDDEHYLQKAEELLKNIAAGKSIVEQGKISRGANPIRSMNALNLASKSLEYMEKNVDKDANSSKFINAMAEDLHSRKSDANFIRSIIKFFEYLGKSFASTIVQSHRQNDRARFELA